MSKKKEQLDAINEFSDALHRLKEMGVKIYYQEGLVQVIEFADRESGQHLGEFASAELMFFISGHILDELALSRDYFGTLLDDEDGSCLSKT